MLDITNNAGTVAPAPNQIGGGHAHISGARVQQHALDQAREYLARVVPWPAANEPGYVTLAYTVPGDKPDTQKWRHRAVRTLDEAEKALTYILSQPNTMNVYACMSLQAEAKEITAKSGFKFLAGIRNQQNALALKSLFLDVDAYKGYGSHKEAGVALAAFIKKIGLPAPSTLVNSGGGLHVYFTFDRALTPGEWLPLANALVNAAKDFGLHFDAGCTIDAARVLRIPQTFNRKLATPRPVKLITNGKHPEYSYEDLEKILAPYKGVITAKVTKANKPDWLKNFPPRPPIKEATLGANCRDEIQFDIDQIATHCPFIKTALDTGGCDYSQPLWNLTTLISTFCEDGRAQAHRMGNQHPEYTQESTDELFDRKERERAEKSIGWPRCETISNNGCKACQSCPYFTNGKSPLHLAPPRCSSSGQVTSPGNSTPFSSPAGASSSAIAAQVTAPVAGQAGILTGADPLDFVTTTATDGVDRMNNEYFFRRDTSEVCRQDAVSGEIQVLAPQQLKTVALAGRWIVDAVDPKTGKTQVRDAATVWLESRRRREVLGVQYCPNNVGLRRQHLNLWLGWGLDPAPGDCSIIVDHIFQILAGNNQGKAEFVLNWLADILQNPTRKPGVALVLRGDEGTGKTVMGAMLRRILGERNVLVNSDKDRILGKFNAALAGKILIQAEESFFAGDSRTSDALKHLITGQIFDIELKFGRTFQIDSFHRLIITSNHSQVIQASSESRRFVVCEASNARRGDAEYFDRLYAVADGRDDSTARAFMQHLLDRDLSNFRPWKAQQQFLGDEALVRQKVLSLSPPLAWLYEVIQELDGHCPPNQSGTWSDGKLTGGKWPTKLRRSVALEQFRKWVAIAKPHAASAFTGSEQRFWSEITKVIPRHFTLIKDSDGNRCVTISLDDLRVRIRRYTKGEPNE
jgi:hypothetical protein